MWYLLVLVFLFVGISIISEVFMDAITVITSKKNEFISVDEATGYKVRKTVPVWNPTMANLTLMAFGSSAPEILLNCIETVKTLDGTPSELGIAGIIGSASFNFLVITGVSIASVNAETDTRTEAELEEDDTPLGIKKIRDLGVFGVTGVSSLLAYAWLWWCLKDKVITMTEAFITFGSFFVLLALAFGADKINSKRTKDRVAARFGGSGDSKVAIEGQEKPVLVGVPDGDGVTIHPIPYTYMEVYEHLVKEEKGHIWTTKDDRVKSEQMRAFLMDRFGTSSIAHVDD